MSSQSDHGENSPLLEQDRSRHEEEVGVYRPHRLLLYTSHFLSTWNARVFEFSATLFLAAILPKSFAPLSVYAMFRSLSVVLFAGKIGHYIDTTNRLQVMRQSIVYQRLAVVLSCVLLAVMVEVVYSPDGPVMGPNTMLLLAGVTVLGCVERLCANMNMLSIERDWVVVIANEHTPTLLILNSQMRRIDLLCKLVGPLAISFLVDFAGVYRCIWILLVLNFTSLFVEYFTIKKVYDRYERLAWPKAGAALTSQDGGLIEFIQTWLTSMKLYVHHAMFIPSFSISILYLTVLAFGAQFVAFLLFSGYSPSLIGILRSIGVCFELSAVSAAPVVMRKIGPVKSATWFVSWQAITIVAALVYSLLSEDKLRGVHVLVAGVIVSRFGLWGFDLSVQVQIQQGVEAENRARFSSIESAFQSIFEMVSYLSTIIFQRPDQFKYPAIISATAITVSCVLYGISAIRKHGPE